VIRFEDVHKAYGNIEVLKGISAEIGKGEVVCLIGPSGSGKSTLLRCANGLETYQKGSVTVDGIRVDTHSRDIHRIRTLVSMVFQKFNLFPHRTVLENVMEGPVHVLKEPKPEARERALALLKRVGLEQKIDAYPSRLSGGQQQRVAIARALAMRPKAILFDEPTSALDPGLVGEVLSVMRALAREHMTMLVVTHEIQFAREVADRVLFLDDGRIVEHGPAKDVLRSPQHERTKDFLRRVTHPAGLEFSGPAIP
jgi:polar amino acid transport system ATP-binding protein